jgi:tetratricopeptide (TPR) repeat protein
MEDSLLEFVHPKATSWPVLEQQGERNWAEKLYERILDEAPESCDATFRLGYLRLLRGDYQSSAMAFQICIERRPDWPEACLNAGIAFARCGNAAAARHHFLEPSASAPTRRTRSVDWLPWPWSSRITPRRTTCNRRLIEMGERGAELFCNAGLICQKRDMTEEAVTFYQQALTEELEFAEALLNLGHALMSLGQEEEARSFWRRAIREKPELAQTYFEPA